MSLPREMSRDTGRGVVISKYPDVCRSPHVPVPYTIVGVQGDDAGTAATVRATGERLHKQSSIITQVAGDEPGTGLGVKSGTVGSVCHRKTHSSNVRVEGEWATRHGDEWWMNNKNTVGKLAWVESTDVDEPTPPLEWEKQGRPQREPYDANESETGEGEPQIMRDWEPGNAEFWKPNAVLARAPGAGGGTTMGRGPSLRRGRRRYNPSLPPGIRDLRAPRSPGGPPSFFREVRPVRPGNMINPPVWYVPRGMPDIPPGDITQIPNPPHPYHGTEHYLGEKIWFRHEDGSRYSAEQIDEAYRDRKKNWTETDPLPGPLPSPERNRVTRKGDPNRKCKTGRYGSLKCPSGEQAHHIVPDYALRYGTRDEGVQGKKRIPGLPSFRDGPAICLQGYKATAGDEQSIAHSADVAIATLGANGQAPIREITAASLVGIQKARPECYIQAVAEVAVQPSLIGLTPARTTIAPPGVWPPSSKPTP